MCGNENVSVKIPRECDEALSSQGTKDRRDEEQIMTKQPPMHEQWRTAIEEPPWERALGKILRA